MNDLPIIQPPRLSHQQSILDDTRDKEIFALFWEQGTMKTRPMIDTAVYNYQMGRINALVIITDDGIHSNWVHDELPAWLPTDWVLGTHYDVIEYHSKKGKTKTQQNAVRRVLNFNGLAIIAMSWAGALDTEIGKAALWSFLSKRKCLLVADETTAVKTHDSNITEVLVKAAPYAKMRRILNGTPVDNSPLDVYSQMLVLDKDFWIRELQIGSFTAFKTMFAVMKKTYYNDSPYKQADPKTGRPAESGGRIGKDFFPVILTFKNTDILKAAIDKISSRVLKDDVLDLPPKVFTWEMYIPSTEEQRVYNQLKEDAAADVGGETIECIVCNGAGDVADLMCPKCFGSGVMSKGVMTATMPIVRMLRFQQVLGGYYTADNEPIADLPGSKPRLEALERILKRGNGPWITWSRFQRDIDKIGQLCHDLGLRYGNYDGRTDPDRRTWIRQNFQRGELDVFNANPAAASKGITLTKARTAIFYNNSFRLGHRLQAEDRCHRGVMDHAVTYIDIAWHGSIDHHIAKNLRKKMDLAAAITGDQLKRWLL